MNLVKVKFLRDGIPSGREYTYRSEIDLQTGDTVELPHPKPVPDGTPYNRGTVTAVNVPETEIEAFKDKVKAIISKIEREGEGLSTKQF